MADAPATAESRGRTIGIGSMAVDRLQRVVRILGPEEKGMVVPTPDGVHVHAQVGGVVLNHLGWAAALGLPTGIFGKQADDEGGRFLRDAMDRHGIARQIVCDGSASTVADIFIDPEGGRAIYMAPGATAETTAAHIRTHHAEWIRAAARVTTEVSQLPLDAVREVQAIAQEAGVPTVLDLDVPPSDAVPGLGSEADLDAAIRAATLLKPAKAAARELVPDAGADALAVAVALRDRFGNDAVVVTDGEAGCAIAADGVALRVPAAAAKEVVDTTGAGDAFLGALLVALAHELSWEDAGRFANAAGAACVEKLGAFPDDPAAARARVAELYDGSPLPLDAATQADTADNAKGASPGAEALATLDTALAELGALRGRATAAAFDAAVQRIRTAQAAGARVHVTGVGKPEHVARYAAGLLSSTGTPATFLHATEAIHGSVGQIVEGDVVIAISNSGTTEELLACVDALRAVGADCIAVTGDPDSPLAEAASIVLDARVGEEGGGLGLAPRASIAAEALVLAALSAALERAADWSLADYHRRHPAGALGRRSRPE